MRRRCELCSPPTSPQAERPTRHATGLGTTGPRTTGRRGATRRRGRIRRARARRVRTSQADPWTAWPRRTRARRAGPDERTREDRRFEEEAGNREVRRGDSRAIPGHEQFGHGPIWRVFDPNTGLCADGRPGTRGESGPPGRPVHHTREDAQSFDGSGGPAPAPDTYGDRGRRRGAASQADGGHRRVASCPGGRDRHAGDGPGGGCHHEAQAHTSRPDPCSAGRFRRQGSVRPGRSEPLVGCSGGVVPTESRRAPTPRAIADTADQREPHTMTPTPTAVAEHENRLPAHHLPGRELPTPGELLTAACASWSPSQ